MLDSLGATPSDKWTRMDRSILFIIIFMIATTNLPVIVLIMVGLGLDRPLLLTIWIVLTPMILLLLGVYRQRKGMWLKRFNRPNDIVIKVIDGLLTRERRMYRRRSLDGPVGSFPVKYVEFFEINGGELLIKVEKQTQMGSIVEVGPVTGNNDIQLDNLKKLLDEAFLPRGL